MIKPVLTLAALASMAILPGCASTNSLDPGVSNAITTAYTAMCGPAGIVASAAPFAANPNVAKYLSEAQAICANGAPTNEIVAGLDIFNVYLDLSQALGNKSAVRNAKALKMNAHRG